MVNWDTANISDLVYAIPEGSGIVIIPRAQALELAAIVDAVERAATWGELRARLPEGEWERILEQNELEDRAPADDDPFEADELFGWPDGDYPDWPSQRALKWVPADIAERYGEVMDSSINGEFLHIPEENETALVAAFRERGTRIEKDPAVVLRATRFI